MSNVIGNRDVIHTGVNGFVCSNTEDYVKAIQKVKTENVKHLVETAYQEIVDTYNTKNMANEYSKIYLSKMGGGTKKRNGCTSSHR